MFFFIILSFLVVKWEISVSVLFPFPCPSVRQRQGWLSHSQETAKTRSNVPFNYSGDRNGAVPIGKPEGYWLRVLPSPRVTGDPATEGWMHDVNMRWQLGGKQFRPNREQFPLDSPSTTVHRERKCISASDNTLNNLKQFKYGEHIRCEVFLHLWFTGTVKIVIVYSQIYRAFLQSHVVVFYSILSTASHTLVSGR